MLILQPYWKAILGCPDDIDSVTTEPWQ